MKLSIPWVLPSGKRGLWLLLAALVGVGTSAATGYRAAGAAHATVPVSGWKVRVAKVQHAPGLPASLTARSSSGAILTLSEGADVPPDTTLVTDAHTRASLEGSDGTRLALDTDSELTVHPARVLRLEKGVLLADVAHVEGAPHAALETPRATVDVVGTRLEVTAQPERTHVEVLRGSVRVASPGNPATEVLAGQEAVISESGVDLAAAGDLAARVAFGEQLGIEPSHNDDADAPSGGLGELRARKPGSTDEKDHALRLARHAVKVRVVGGVARTEVDETFANDSDETLEGVYRFPLPAGAQVERLALEVDDKLIDGAFVDKSKGQAIWRGAIQNATPKAPRPVQEIFWVPGPWRDPALLEWQRGGRFELKIFPIPKRASRRVVIAYTEDLAPVAGRRRYVYPLPSDPKLAIDDLFVDVQVLGNDPAVPVRVRGYELDAAKVDGGQRFSRDLGKTSPSGDLTVEYALPAARSELSAWSFSDTHDKSTDRFALVALRPKLPSWGDSKPRDYVIVVDSGRAMFGERFRRASRLAEQLTEEMDRRDRVTVLSCDLTCKRMPGGMLPAGSGSAHDVDAFLAGVTQDGASDLGAAVREAGKLPDPSREARVVLLSDGVASSGYRSPARLGREIAALTDARTTVVTVPIGSDADTSTLGEIARAGGGAMVPYAPGEPLEAAALEVLAATYGKALRDVHVTLPDGLGDVAPESFAPVRAGGELLVAARMRSEHVTGDVVLTGTLAGEPFSAKYPLDLAATSDAGNAFVPREFAALRINDVERRPGDANKAELVALSQRFAVPSKYTSLLVLESEAMFSAFGIDRSAHAQSWSGETAAVTTSLADDDAKDEASALGGLLGDGRSSGGGAPSDLAPRASAESSDAFSAAPEKKAAPAPAATASAAPQGGPRTLPSWGGWEGNRRRGGQFMKRVWHREATISADVGASVPFDKLADARAKLAASPDERQRTLELVKLLTRAGDVRELAATVDAWQKRDPLDDAAIAARADVLAMSGDRDASLRVRSGVLAALRSPDPAVLDALATSFERERRTSEACSVRIAAAEARPDDDERVFRALSCERDRGRDGEVKQWLAELPSARAASVAKQLDARKSDAGEPVTAGDLVIDAAWSSGEDLDLAVIDPSGARVSWTSSARFAKVADASAPNHETLSVTNGNAGAFTIEISRAIASPHPAPVRGTLTIKALGERKSVPFELIGDSSRVARVDARWESELVPADPDEVSAVSAPFDRSSATRAISGVSVAHCHDPQGGGGGVALVTFASSGRVLTATARGPFSPAAVSCVSSAFRGLSVSPFSGAPETVSRSIVVGP